MLRGLGCDGAAELADLATRRSQLEDEQEKLLRAHYAGAVPLELLKREQDRITASLETIQNRIDAHHGEYAFARANLDDSLTLLSNPGDIYKTADDANRRLCNQALFKAIYVDEDNDVRVGCRTPYDGLSIEGVGWIGLLGVGVHKVDQAEYAMFVLKDDLLSNRGKRHADRELAERQARQGL